MRGFGSQPTVVWAVAGAAVVSFMGLGLVDPILPAIARELQASPSDVELLFTSYFAFTGVSMLVSGVVASRIGAKRTLLGGLALIILFSALAGASNSIAAIVGLRAGWGLGNALFIATALSVIVGAASGGVASAVMIYEAALGFGISLGPLLGGELGAISWRGPFYGVAVLMAIGFVAIALFLPKQAPPAKEQRISLLEPFRALRHRATRGSAITAVFYNFGFFTLLGFAPFPLHLGVHDLGYTFTGWGLLLAIFAVFVAPRISRRYGDVRGLGGALMGIVVVLVVMGVWHDSQTLLIVCVVCSGMFFGVTNTLMTQVVMETAEVPRPIASSAYSFVRFCGGAIAPFVAGKLGEHVSVPSAFYLGAVMTAVAVAVLTLHREALVPFEQTTTPTEAELRDAHATPSGGQLVAVAGPDAEAICQTALTLATAPVHVLHVVERDVLAGEDVVDTESESAARELLARCVTVFRSAGVPVYGELAHVTGSHSDVADVILRRSRELGVNSVVLGAETRHGPLGGQVSAEIVGRAPTHVIVLHPSAGPLAGGVAQSAAPELRRTQAS